MSEEKLSAAINKIEAALKDRPSNEITGALLGELIRRVAPDLNIREFVKTSSGQGALSVFVETHLRNILIHGRKQGSDNVFIVRSTEALPPGSTNPDIWRTFVRANSPWKLVIHENNIDLELAQNFGQASSETKIVIPSATNGELDQIRRDFAATLGEKASQLPPVEQPYGSWSAALQRLGQQHYRQWTEYRLQKIFELFADRLRELGIPQDQHSHLINIMKRSQQASHTTRVPSKVVSTVPSSNAQTSTDIGIGISNTDSSFRDFVILAVKTLSLSELRELRLPVGAFYDAILQNTKEKQ